MCLQLWCSLNRLFRKIWGEKRAFPCTFSPTECGILKTRPSIMNSENSFYAYLFVSHEVFVMAENRKNKRYWSELSKIS